MFVISTLQRLLPLARRTSIYWLVWLLLSGCGAGGDGAAGTGKGGGRHAVRRLRLATTTSARDSGVLDQLLPVFERTNNCRVDVVAVGTGAALKLGESGDADLLIVHARQAELEFMAAGHGARHEEFMRNTFMLLAPAEAMGEMQETPLPEILQRIASEKKTFVSRGDDSGTHKRELTLWQAAGVKPNWKGYLEVGQGMGATLMIADEKQAFVLVDSGTFFRFRNKISLRPIGGESEHLRNPYSAIAVDPEKHERINHPLADALVDFLIGVESQRIIAEYRIDGRTLFYPTRLQQD